MFSTEQFGQRVQELRKLHNETQKDLGIIIGTKRNNVSDYGRVVGGRTTAEKYRQDLPPLPRLR